MAYWTTFNKSFSGYGPLSSSISWTKANNDAFLSYWVDPASTGSMSYWYTAARRYYRSYYSDYCDYYYSPIWNFVGPFKGGIQPHKIFDGHLKAPMTVQGAVDFAASKYQKLRIQNVDGSKWIEIYIQSGSERAHIDSSNGNISYDIYDGALDDAYCHVQLKVNADGTISSRFFSLTRYSNSCSGNSVLEKEYNPVDVLFDVDEPLIFKYLFDVPDGISTGIGPLWFYVYATIIDPANAPVLVYGNADNTNIPQFSMSGSATQDNSGTEGLLFFSGHYTDLNHFLEFWELNPPTVLISNATYLYFDNMPVAWGARLKWPLLMTVTHSFKLSGPYYLSIVLMNEDMSKWIKIGKQWNSIYLPYIETSEDGVVEIHDIIVSDYGDEIIDLLIGPTDLVVSWADIVTPANGFEATIPLNSVFSPDEKIYLGIGRGHTTDYGRMLEQILFRSPHLPGNADWGQELNNLAIIATESLNVSLEEVDPVEHFCYFKRKIRNSQNYSDPESLYGMASEAPSDLNIPLKAEDTCIVVDKYHRTYFYKVLEGSQQDSLPDIIRITDLLYWQLIDVITNSNMIVEQQDIEGLVDTNEVIITHTQQNRDSSYVPAIQLLHNDTIRTNGITVSIVSDTQLRIKTVETEVITNLKINMYITV